MSGSSRYITDPKCRELEKKLEEYVKVVIEENKKKSDSYGYDTEKINNQHYAFMVELKNYMDTLENVEDKKNVAGNLIHRIVDYFDNKKMNPFEADGLDNCRKIIIQYPLLNNDKKSFAARVNKFGRKGKLGKKALAILEEREEETKMVADVDEPKPVDESKTEQELQVNDTQQNIVTNPEDWCQGVSSLSGIVGHFCKYAKDNKDKKVSVEPIFKLIKKMSETTKKETLFDEHDAGKSAFLEVVKGYAMFTDYDEIKNHNNNEQFDKDMKNLFVRVITGFDYNKEDIDDVKRTLVDNCSDKEFASGLVKDITTGCALAQKQRMLSSFSR